MGNIKVDDKKSWLHIELKPDNSVSLWHSRKRTASAGWFSVKLLPVLYTNPDPATCLSTAYSETAIQKWGSARGSLLIAIRMSGASSSQMTWKEIFNGNEYEVMHTIVLNYNCTRSQRGQEQGTSWRKANLDLLATVVAVLPQHQSWASTAWKGLLCAQQAPGKGKITSQIQVQSRKYRSFSHRAGAHLQHSQGRNMSREGEAVSLRQPLKSPGSLWILSAFSYKMEFSCRKHCEI